MATLYFVPDQSDNARGKKFVQRAPRCDLILKVAFEHLGQLQDDYLTNIGSGGIFLRTPLPLPVGQSLQLTISLPTGEPLDVEGEVAWTSSERKTEVQGVGIAFRNLDAGTKARLELLVKARETAAVPSKQKVPVHLLLQENNQILREIFSYELYKFSRTQGWELELSHAENGDGTMKLLKARRANLAIIDLDSVPGTFLELVGQVRNQSGHSALPIVGLLGHETPMRTDGPLTMLVKKPVAMKPLLATLAALVAARPS